MFRIPTLSYLQRYNNIRDNTGFRIPPLVSPISCVKLKLRLYSTNVLQLHFWTKFRFKVKTAKSAIMVSTCMCYMNGGWISFRKSEILINSVLLGDEQRSIANNPLGVMFQHSFSLSIYLYIYLSDNVATFFLFSLAFLDI